LTQPNPTHGLTQPMAMSGPYAITYSDRSSDVLAWFWVTLGRDRRKWSDKKKENGRKGWRKGESI